MTWHSFVELACARVNRRSHMRMTESRRPARRSRAIDRNLVIAEAHAYVMSLRHYKLPTDPTDIPVVTDHLSSTTKLRVLPSQVRIVRDLKNIHCQWSVPTEAHLISCLTSWVLNAIPNS
jgi:hypothetical protein